MTTDFTAFSHQAQVNDSQQLTTVESKLTFTFTPSPDRTGIPADGPHRVVRGVVTDSTGKKSTAPAVDYRGSKNFQPTNKSNPCPICENVTGKCRIVASANLVLCMTHQEPLAGWRFQGTSSDGLWGKYFPNDPNWQPTYTPTPQAVKKPKAEWSRKQWDQHNRAIVRQTKLNASDQADIEKRLHRAGLSTDLLLRLNPTSLTKGYLIPCPDSHGNLLRGQVRFRDEHLDENGKNRYRWQWPNDGVDGHIDGELPLGCWQPVTPQQRPIEAVLTEGTGVKPFIAAQILGVPAIGAAGGNHAGSPQLLKEALGMAKTVGLGVDAGAILNRHVLGQYQATQELLEDWGITLLYIWWGQTTKDQEDIDEGIDPSTIQWLAPAQFWAMVAPDNQPVLAATEARKAAEIASLQAYRQRAHLGWQERREFTADITVNQQFCPPIPAGDSAIKTAMETGKTYQVERLCAEWDGGVILVGSRNALLLQTIERINATAPSNCHKCIHIHNEDSNLWALRDPKGRVALCWDSIHRFENPSWFDGKLVILDESVGSIKHLLDGGTLQIRRKPTLIATEEMLRRAGRVVVLDGNQNDTVVGYVEELRGNRLTRLSNSYQPRPCKITISTPEKPRDHSGVLGELLTAVKAGERTVIVSDSQRLCEVLDEILTGMGRKVFRVDSKTVSDTNFRKLVSDPNLGRWLVEQGFTDVILSPSAESGLNIATNGYFSKGFGIFYGILDTDSQTQILRRVREVTDWLVHCPPYSIAKRSNGPRSCIEGTLGRSTLEAIALELSNAALEGGDLQPFVDLLGASIHHRYQIKLRASRNYEYSNTRQCLVEVLQSQGHTAILTDLGTNNDAKEAVKKVRNALITADSKAIFEAEPIPIDRARAIKGSFSASLNDRWKAERAILLDKLPGIENTSHWTPDLVEMLVFRDRGAIRELQNWWLITHLDIAKNRTQRQIQSIIDGKGWLGDLPPNATTLEYITRLGLPDLVGRDTPITAADIQTAYQSAKRSKKARTLGVAPGPQEPPFKWVGRILRSIFGIRSRYQQVPINGKRVRVYFYVPSPYLELSHFIAANLQKAFGESCQLKWPQSQSKQGLEAEHTPTNNPDYDDVGVFSPNAAQNKAFDSIDKTSPQLTSTVTLTPAPGPQYPQPSEQPEPAWFSMAAVLKLAPRFYIRAYRWLHPYHSPLVQPLEGPPEVQVQYWPDTPEGWAAIAAAIDTISAAV